MKATKSGKSKPSATRGLKDLTPQKTKGAKGGASAHEAKKSIIGNFPR